MHPQASWLRRANGLYLAHPHIGFALFSHTPLVPLFSLGGWGTHKWFLSYASQHLSGPRTHGQHRLHEQSTPAFVADLSHAADLVTMRQINVGGILHQQHHGSGRGLFPGLLKVRLHQRRKGHIWLIEQTIQRFGLFPGVHLSWQGTQGILCQVAGRLYRSSRSTYIMQLDSPKGSLGPALGIQQVLCVHPLLYHFVTKCKVAVRLADREEKGDVVRTRKREEKEQHRHASDHEQVRLSVRLDRCAMGAIGPLDPSTILGGPAAHL